MWLDTFQEKVKDQKCTLCDYAAPDPISDINDNGKCLDVHSVTRYVILQGPPREFAHFQSDFCQLLYLSHFLPKLTEW
jgi:hypothetical protein